MVNSCIVIKGYSRVFNAIEVHLALVSCLKTKKMIAKSGDAFYKPKTTVELSMYSNVGSSSEPPVRLRKAIILGAPFPVS